MGVIKADNTPYGLRLRQEEKNMRILKTTFFCLLTLAMLACQAPVAENYMIRIKATITGNYTVDVKIATNIPGSIVLSANLALQGQEPDDTFIGTEFIRVPITDGTGKATIDGSMRTLPHGSKLPAGDYDVEVSFHPRWPDNSAAAKAAGIKDTIEAKASVTLSASGQSSTSAKGKAEGKRQKRYHSEPENFSFVLPNGWSQIPDSQIQSFNDGRPKKYQFQGGIVDERSASPKVYMLLQVKQRPTEPEKRIEIYKKAAIKADDISLVADVIIKEEYQEKREFYSSKYDVFLMITGKAPQLSVMVKKFTDYGYFIMHFYIGNDPKRHLKDIDFILSNIQENPKREEN
jgi:hypothetical protein